MRFFFGVFGLFFLLYSFYPQFIFAQDEKNIFEKSSQISKGPREASYSTASMQIFEEGSCIFNDSFGDVWAPFIEKDPFSSSLAPRESPPFWTGDIRWLVNGQAFHYSAIVPRTVDASPPRDPPIVFLNYDETITDGELGDSFIDVGLKNVVLFPNASEFVIGSSHANGSKKCVMRSGVRFVNHSSSNVIALDISWPPANWEGQQLLSPLQRLAFSIPPGKSVDAKVVQAKIHTTPNVRDGSCPAIFNFFVSVKTGDPQALEIRDIACQPESTVVNPSPHSPGEKYHHQGVYQEQVQVGAPLALKPNVVASLAIRGTQVEHNAHYEARHRFFITFLPGKEPKSLVFYGTGGYAYPVINGKRRGSVQLVPRRDINGNVLYKEIAEGDKIAKYLVINEFKSLSIPFSEAKKWLISVEAQNPDSPVYALDITFKPRDNGNLGVMAQY
ncbi:hypothetical protein HYY75_01130 [bacterium]|nr:hypothetical protein [bacterium]